MPLLFKQTRATTEGIPSSTDIGIIELNDNPYFMEANDIVYRKMVCLSEPVKCAQLSEYLGMERKVVDLAMKHLKEDGKVVSPKRGYWEII